jgi:hypothetical protein
MTEDINFLFVFFCIGMGVAGQAIRAFMGFYKLYTDPISTVKSKWEWGRFVLSLILGACIGSLLSLIYNSPASRTDILGIIAASYGGVDFLEGFLKHRGDQVK